VRSKTKKVNPFLIKHEKEEKHMKQLIACSGTDRYK